MWMYITEGKVNSPFSWMHLMSFMTWIPMSHLFKFLTLFIYIFYRFIGVCFSSTQTCT
jgi:hypothetical protein